ncbi:MAG: hypothetical protein NTU81_00715 [Candidatus Nomurabacteria bacterium]|nr:hypothetical protein [Candidatus Nomurabacteria bacterium]
MIENKNYLNLNQNNTSRRSIYSGSQVDSLIKNEKLSKTEKKKTIITSEIISDIKPEVLNETSGEEVLDSSVDDSKRLFLKIAGVAGLGLAASALFPNQADAYVTGSTPTSNVVGVKNIANTRINPATETTVATLATQATLLTTNTTLDGIKTQSDKLSFDASNNLLINGTINTTGATNIGKAVDDQSIWMLRKILNLMKPLGMTTGGGSNRLSVDVNNIVAGTITTVTTIATLTNITNLGNVNAFSLMKDSARNAYSNSIRSKISF